MDVGLVTTKIIALRVQRTKICSVMFRLIVLYSCSTCVYSTVEPGNHEQCGPRELCVCKRKLEMDCINSDLQLNGICEYINNTIDFDIDLLRVKSSYIRIDVLKGNDLRGCENLLELYLSENGISEIENNAFDRFKRLNTLDIGNNNINLYDASEDSSSMIHFPGTLKVLLLMGNYNMSMYDNLSYPNLSNLVNLHTLVIDGLPLTNFKATYKSLRYLHNITMSGFLSHCNISYVSNETFIHLANVRYLDISACNIIGVDAFGFGTLGDLEILDLSRNMRLEFRALRNITYGLQYTDIRVINISQIHTTFGPGTRIRLEDVCYLWNTSLNEIDISRNRLEMCENNALWMLPKSINIIRAEYNKFTMEAYMAQVGCFSNLTELYLSFQFAAYDPTLFNTEYQGIDDRDYNKQEYCPLKVEALARNDLICPYFKPGEKIIITNYRPQFPQNIKRIEITESDLIYDVGNLDIVTPSDTLEYADLSGNVLYSWRGPLRTFNNIKHLYLSKNYCSYVTKSFFKFAKKSLEHLRLDKNFLGLVLNNETNGPFFLNYLSELKILNLSYNIISHIPRNLLLGSHKIEILDLSVNNIEQFTLDVSRLNLLHLILHNNFLQSLPYELRNRLEENSKRRGQMFTIDLRNNTININCESKDYLKWLVSHKDHMVGFDDYIFVNSNGKRITSDDFKTEVHKLDARCRSYTLIIVVSVIFFSVFLALVFGVLIYKNRWNLRYILRNAKFKHFQYKRMNENMECQYRYDVFVSYANENSDFIRSELYPRLEQKDLRVCLHEKHFMPGNNIADNILEAISISRKTLIILSNDYVDSKWCMYEFNMARMESIYDRDGSSCLCVVLLEDVATEKMPNEMLQWLRRNTYIEYTNDEQGQICFWENLERAVCDEM